MFTITEPDSAALTDDATTFSLTGSLAGCPLELPVVSAVCFENSDQAGASLFFRWGQYLGSGYLYASRLRFEEGPGPPAPGELLLSGRLQ
jgi:hypothetical protein